MSWPVVGSWYTPAKIVNAARDVMGSIDLDPASCPDANQVVRARGYFTREDDGLAQDWYGNVWLNSPTDTIDRFVDKLFSEHKSGNVRQAIMFTHNHTHEDWYQLLAESAKAISLPAGRIEHWRPAGNGGREYFTPPWGQSIFYFGGDADVFYMTFKQFGTVWVR